ncbi:uncharacterized protein PV09_05728 [Verruconis gallopava]|uniref:Uncharacterized protein n=1 Tax=Verruconis gallopava TaxID=253628 RepID=A0A0D2A8L3_9PEZI|nr:uncharacterized protein PV09_05728 [Verruconis gallopava]KIW03083.1 hypothetical protein PV09_05728 [Verruconis gallopava]
MSGPSPSGAVVDHLTVIITTSPVPSAPSTELLTDVLDSFARHCPLLLRCRVIVVFDSYERVCARARLKKGAVTAEQAAAFAAYVASVKALVLRRFGRCDGAGASPLERSAGEAEFGSPFDPANAVPLVQLRTADGRVTFVEPARCLGFSLAVRSALRLAATRYVWVHQHDWRLTTTIPVASMLSIMRERDADDVAPVRYICLPSVRLLNYAAQSDNTRFAAFRQLTQRLKQVFHAGPHSDGLEGAEPVSLTPLFFWFDKPHIASTAHYLRCVFPSRYATRRSTFIEDTIGHRMRELIKNDPEAWAKFATWLYYPGEGETLCLKHLDGRVWRGSDGEKKAAEKWRSANGAHHSGSKSSSAVEEKGKGDRFT